MALTEKAIKKHLFPIIRGPVLRESSFVPANATMTMKSWLNSLQLTVEERKLALKFVEQFLAVYEKRLRLILLELKQSVERE